MTPDGVARPAPPTVLPTSADMSGESGAADFRFRLVCNGMDGIHDMGGMHGFGPVDPSATESCREGWETRLQATAILARAMTRGDIEAIEPATYLDSTYHERWVIAAERGVVSRGVISPETLARWQEQFASDAAAQPPRTDDPDRVTQVQALVDRSFALPSAQNPRFSVGDRVRVRRMRPERHHRSPRYIRGVVGEVERVACQDHVPGTRFSANQTEPVYTVRFSSVDLWGDRVDEGEGEYDLFIDQWESYLEAADE